MWVIFFFCIQPPINQISTFTMLSSFCCCTSTIILLRINCWVFFSVVSVAIHSGQAHIGQYQCEVFKEEFPYLHLIPSFESKQCGIFDDRLSLPQMDRRSSSLYNYVSVEWYGPAADGETDDVKSFIDAWNDACSLDSAVLSIPAGRSYLVSPYTFKGPCGHGLTLEIAGTVKAPSAPWNKSKSNSWLHFSQLNDFTIEGGGTIDGQGQGWWAQSCKVNKKNKCHDAPTALMFSSVQNVTLRNIRSQNSQQIHVDFSQSQQIQIDNVRIEAPKTSPNTDGIHISHTKDVLIQNSIIATGDDCISIVTGSSNIQIRNITCGPGHGISIGSLGKDNSEAFVSLVAVDGATLTGTSNGARIKTWQGGSGSATGFRFQNIHMVEVAYPIIIDQFYCDSSSPCPINETSAVRISEVTFANITGTSRTHQAVKLACSDAMPCENVFLEDIYLTMPDGGDTVATCENAEGAALGTIMPPSCLG